MIRYALYDVIDGIEAIAKVGFDSYHDAVGFAFCVHGYSHQNQFAVHSYEVEDEGELLNTLTKRVFGDYLPTTQGEHA